MTSDDERLQRLLREAGDLEQTPPSRVWEAIRAEVEQDEGRHHRPSAAPRRGPGRLSPLLLAAAAGAGLMYAGVQLMGSDGAPRETVVATGELRPVAGEQRLGEAEVLDRDGRRVLRVDLDELPDSRDGYLEVWLLKPDVSGLVTLGVLDAANEEFLLPAGLDLGEFPVVDISVEHLDGDPGHGGDSLVRGQVG